MAATGALRQYLLLCKPRVVVLIVFTAVVGMLLAAPGMVPLDALVFGTVHAHSADAIFEAAEARGMRLVAGKVLMDSNCPEELRDDPVETARLREVAEMPAVGENHLPAMPDAFADGPGVLLSRLGLVRAGQQKNRWRSLLERLEDVEVHRVVGRGEVRQVGAPVVVDDLFE